MTSAKKHNFGDSAVIVARVSTPQQTESPQIQDLREYAQGLGYKNIQAFGTTESGFLELDDKQGWNLVVDFFEAHPEYKTLICTELSRLSRIKSTLMLIEEYLLKNHIQLIVKDINFFLFNELGVVTAGNDMIFSLYASLASSEMSHKRERFKRALKEYRQHGYSIGGKELFGYTREYVKVEGRNKPISRYVINEKEKQEILQIYRWYAFGIDGDLSRTSTRTITEKCIEEGMSTYLHSKRNVTKCLKERAYTGFKETHNRMKNPEYWNYHKYDKPKYINAESYLCLYPPIFEGEDAFLFDYVQNRMHDNNSKVSKGVVVLKERKHTTILSKLLVCPVCGRFLHGEYRMRDGLRQFTYRCAYSSGVVHKCSFLSTLSMQMLDSLIWEVCKEAITGIRISELREKSGKATGEIQQKIMNIQSKIDEYEGRYITEETIFRMHMIKAKSKEERDEAVKNYERRVATLSKEQKALISRQSELRVELAEVQGKNDIRRLIHTNKHLNNKEYISRYIHRVVKSIDILYTDKSYTVLRINMPSYVYSGNRYLCIFKRNTLSIKAVSITELGLLVKPKKDSANQPIMWDKTRMAFLQGENEMSLQDIYEYAINDKRWDGALHMNTKVIPYHRLECYSEDIRKKEIL